MGYLDPLRGQTSRNDWSGRDDDGRDERPRVRHTGSAPDPYVGERPADLGDARAPYRTPTGYGSDAYAPDPYAAFRESSAVTPFVAGGSFGDLEPSDDGADAYPRRSGRFDAPAWDSPTAATPASQPELDVVADPDRRHGPGRRRAGRGARAGDAAPRTGRAGRNLGAAILVGSSLGAVVLVSLFVWPSLFGGVVVAAVSVGIWEMARAIRTGGANPPLVPLLAGGVAMVGLAWYAGPDGLIVGLLATVLAALLWRLGDGPGAVRRDLTATVLIAVYVPFLLGFGMLLVEPAGDGSFRVLATLLAVVLSDTGGYAAGVFFGKHPMAPAISPKKSWEGFAGSLAAAALGSAVLLSFALDVRVPVYYGALFGVVIAIVAVLGDLTESMMKRDLGIKDMSQLLPGHGGLMDRLDSILFAVPTAFLLLSLIAPPP
jgi:phosphatidate cytidylyltransferase